MSDSTIVEVAVIGFRDFVDEVLDRNKLRTCTSVEQLIALWLSDGNAAEDCRCDFRIFLSAVACIFAEYHDTRCTERDEYVVPPHINRARFAQQQPGQGRLISDIFDPYVFIASVEKYRWRSRSR